jgi:predicted RNase H-like nuclease (RuvC/YqgF family)
MADIEGLRNKITNLEGANTTLYESIEELKNKIKDLESDIERFDPEKVLYIDKLESSTPFRKLRMYVQRLNAKEFGNNRETNAKIAELENDINNLKIMQEILGIRVPRGVDMVATLVNEQGGGGKRRKNTLKRRKVKLNVKVKLKEDK